MLRFFFTLIVTFCIAAPVWADDNSATRNAFEYAQHKDWANAFAFARRSSDPTLLKLISWEYALDPDSGASFDEIASFIDANHNWPDQKKLHLRAEMSLKTSNVPDNNIISWFGNTTPVSGIGKITLAGALIRNQLSKEDDIITLIRDAWRDGDFDEAQEDKILDSYGSKLRKDDHIARINRLLWEDHITPAKHILSMVPDTYQKLFRARIALKEDKSLAGVAVAQVASSLRDDSGLTFDRMMYRARRDDDAGVREMLLNAPSDPPYPEKWWKQREYQIRKAIDEQKYSLAKKLLSGRGQLEGANLADSMWLQGWLKTEFMNDARGGQNDFAAMYDAVKYPVSKARAAYWAGRSAEKSEEMKVSQQWFQVAATYPTTFYGQLSALKTNESTLDIPDAPPISNEDRAAFDRSDVTQAIKLCIRMNALDFATHLISMSIENSDNEAEIAMLSELGIKAGHVHLSVHAAKKALQQNVVLVDAGYPLIDTPAADPIEPALTLAITRQESEFDARVVSPAGAIGMMQLLPGTAKEIARKNGLGFSKDRLYEAKYNMNIGSLYLSRLINSYDGSYILAIAAYNAGPGNVHNWVQDFGTPNNNLDNAINWIEKIPFKETRNYVQRVMENLQVFRHLQSENDSPKIRIGEDLVR